MPNIVIKTKGVIQDQGLGGSVEVTFNADHDTYTDAINPTTNYGGNATMFVDSDQPKQAWVRFPVSGVGSVSSATLRIYANSSNGGGIDIHECADATWDESTLTHNTLGPPAAGTLIGNMGASASSYSELDVTSYVSAAGNGDLAFAVQPVNATNTNLATSESANGPQLVVVHS